MGEDKSTAPSEGVARQRHSSVISSCSEDAESESTSGYPPTPTMEEKEEELEYGPGIVNKLRTRFLTISLKQNRGTNIRRSCSMENLLDQDRPEATSPVDKPTQCTTPGTGNQHWGHLKRAKSMDTLLMEMQSCPENSDQKIKIIKRREDVNGGRLCDEELPKPDTVKTYKRMFEPAESRRGSHCRRPPVLRASAKSCAAAKQNGIPATPSAKPNGLSPKSSKFSAKTSTPVKSTLESGVIDSPVNGSAKKPVINTEPTRPLYNGCHVVKASPVKVSTNGLKSNKDLEKNLNSINRLLNKKEVQFSPKMEIISNGSVSINDVLKIKPRDEIVKQFSKIASANGGITHLKPKVPPNRPSLKSPKSFLRSEGLNENLSPSKLKPVTTNGVRKSIESENQKLTNGLGSKDLNGTNPCENNGETTVVQSIKSPVTKSENKIKTTEVDAKPESKPLSKTDLGVIEKTDTPPPIVPLIEHVSTSTPCKPHPVATVTDSVNAPNLPDIIESIKTPERTFKPEIKTPPKTNLKFAPAVPDKKNFKLDLSKKESPSHCVPLKESPKQIVPQNEYAKHVVPQTVQQKETPKALKPVVPQTTPQKESHKQAVQLKETPKSHKQVVPQTPQKESNQGVPVNESIKTAVPHSTPIKEFQKQSTPQKESPKQFAPQKESEKQSTPQKESRKPAVPQKGPPKQSTPQKEPPKPAAPQKESPKPAAPQKASPKQDAPPKVAQKQSPGQSTSMVFDFRGKNVVPHVAVVPAPFGCKSHPQKCTRDNAADGDEDDEESVDYSVPPPSGVVFEGENVKIGRGSILSKRNKELKITFDDDVDGNTFVYPSETSLLEDPSEAPPADPPPNPGKLKANTTLGSSKPKKTSTVREQLAKFLLNTQSQSFNFNSTRKTR